VLCAMVVFALQGQQESFQDGGDLFVDDQLSDQELDLICGTYDVGTGNRRDQVASLFPKANIWEGSRYNVRHWNQDCEDFYLCRRADIMQGNGVKK